MSGGVSDRSAIQAEAIAGRGARLEGSALRPRG